LLCQVSLFISHCRVDIQAEAFEAFGPAFFVSGVDFFGESARFECVLARHDDDAVAVGDDDVAGKDRDAAAVDGEVIRFGDKAAGAIRVRDMFIVSSLCTSHSQPLTRIEDTACRSSLQERLQS